jgi:hypothetical protein
MKKGTSSLGDKTIMKYRECGCSYTSEDFAIADLCKIWKKAKFIQTKVDLHVRMIFGKKMHAFQKHTCAWKCK